MAGPRRINRVFIMTNRTVLIYGGELYHHGVKGQKWGVRNYQNPDGSLTPLGREHYGIKERLAERKEIKAKQKEAKKDKAVTEMMKSEKITRKEAERRYEIVQNYKRNLAIIAGVSAAAIVGYAAYKYGRNNVMDKLQWGVDGQELKAGSSLFRVAMDPSDIENYNAFYAVNDKADANKYAGMLGLQRAMQNGNDYPYQIKMDLVKDIKVPSKNEARSTFQDLYDKDPEFRKAARTAVNLLNNGAEATDNVDPIAKLFGRRRSGKPLLVSYEQFNRALVVHDSPELVNQLKGTYNFDKQWSKFYDALKSKGYSAIYDVNDGGRDSYSGYNAKNPLIVFDKDAVVFNTSKKLNGGKVAVALLGNDMIENGYSYIAKAGIIAAYAATKKATKDIESKEETKKGQKTQKK